MNGFANGRCSVTPARKRPAPWFAPDLRCSPVRDISAVNVVIDSSPVTVWFSSDLRFNKPLVIVRVFSTRNLSRAVHLHSYRDQILDVFEGDVVLGAQRSRHDICSFRVI